MTKTLGESLALAKQHYEALTTSLLPLDRMRRQDFGEGLPRKKAEELLKKLYLLTSSIDKALSDKVVEGDGAPLQTVARGHLAFYKTHLEPNLQHIHDAYLQISGFAELEELLKDTREGEKPGAPILSALAWGIERWVDMVDPDEKDEWLSRGFDLDAAFEVVQLPWFRPDEWLENFRLLKPVLLDRPAESVHRHVQDRLREIYRAYAFGLWLGAVALCRSLIEFSIHQNAERLGLETRRRTKQNTLVDLPLKVLIAEVGKALPNLSESLETVKTAGDRVMHAKEGNVLSFPALRQEALNCIKATKRVAEDIYRQSAQSMPANNTP
jgi:hypothetical protein